MLLNISRELTACGFIQTSQEAGGQGPEGDEMGEEGSRPTDGVRAVLDGDGHTIYVSE